MTATRWWNALGCGLAMLAIGVIAASPARADDDPWNPGSNWLYFRAGYAKNAAEGAANGGAGYGFGFRHMLTPSRVSQWEAFGHRPLHFLNWTLLKNWSFGGFIEYDMLGHFGSAKELEIPVAVELTRHLMWKGPARPYVTLGVGQFLRMTYGTGDDLRRVTTNGFIATGFDAVVGSGQMLGLDARLARVDSQNSPANPVFGPGQDMANHWSIKLSYAVAY